MADGHKRIDDIEILRGIAISFTLLGHVSQLMYWGSPLIKWFALSLWSGVDLFLCISGFVIARGIVNAIPEKSTLAGFLLFALPFWTKRVFRIWPAALLWIAISLLFTVIFNRFGSFGDLHANVQDAVASIAQVANLHYLDCSYGNGRCNHLLASYWSLSLEEQFYIIFPFFVFFVPSKYLPAALTLGILSQLFLTRPVNSFAWFIRSDALMFGVLIAIAQRHPGTSIATPTFLAKPVASYVSFSAGVMMLALVAWNGSSVTLLAADKSVVWFSTGVITLVAALMVFVASFGADYTLPPSPFRKVLVYIGTRSYALYVSHKFFYYLTQEIFHNLYPDRTLDHHFTIPFILVTVPMLLVSAEATYRFVEVPLRRYGREVAATYRMRIVQ